MAHASRSNAHNKRVQEVQELEAHQQHRRTELEAVHESQRQALEHRIEQEMDAAEQVGCLTWLVLDTLNHCFFSTVQGDGAEQLSCSKDERSVSQRGQADRVSWRATSVD
jgi:hypothetical protein